MFGLGMAPGRCCEVRLDQRQMRTRPLGVWNFAATMPGVPLGATHSTFTSSSGCSTDWPSHSETRAGSPAISRHSSETSPVAPALGWLLGLDVPLDEERQLRVGLQALDAQLLPEQLDAVGAVPVAVDGLAAEACLEGPDVVDRDDPAEPAAAERGAGAHGLAERAPCPRPGGRGPRRPRGRCRRSAAGSSCGCRSGDGCRRRRTPHRAAPRGAPSFPQVLRDRPRRRCGRDA